jgi:hypothetical protein
MPRHSRRPPAFYDRSDVASLVRIEDRALEETSCAPRAFLKILQIHRARLSLPERLVPDRHSAAVAGPHPKGRRGAAGAAISTTGCL